MLKVLEVYFPFRDEFIAASLKATAIDDVFHLAGAFRDEFIAASLKANCACFRDLQTARFPR